jgi:DNA-binding GntR family transcriptional regulator
MYYIVQSFHYGRTRIVRTSTTTGPAKLAALAREIEARQGQGLSRYEQLRAALVATIQAGHWKPGDRLPTESVLARETPFSLGTVQHALRALVEEGRVTRSKGSGTFVASPSQRVDDVAHCRFLADDGNSILPVFSRVLARTPVKRNGPWTECFPDANGSLLRVDRIFNVDGQFDVYSRFFFDGARLPGLASRSLADLAGANFRELLRTELELTTRIAITESLEVTAMPASIASHIGLDAGATGAVMEVVASNPGSFTLYYQQIYIPPSPRKLALRAT